MATEQIIRILIHPKDDAYGGKSLGDEVRKAIEVLRAGLIETEGGGTVMTDGIATGVVIISGDADGASALALLKKAGIRASTDQPRKSK